MAKAKKFDIYAARKADNVTPRKPVLLEIKPAKYLAITGQGDPAKDVFQARLGVLYNVALTVKMARKSAGRDYTVSKPEGLWWVNSDKPFMEVPTKNWRWKLIPPVSEGFLDFARFGCSTRNHHSPRLVALGPFTLGRLSARKRLSIFRTKDTLWH